MNNIPTGYNEEGEIDDSNFQEETYFEEKQREQEIVGCDNE